MKRVAISVINYRAVPLTLRCIEHLERARTVAGNDCEVRLWLLDNGSNPRSRERLRAGLQGKDWVHLSNNDANVGFAAGHNQNLRAALARYHPDFVWILNNDCLVEAGCIRALLSCSAEDPAVAVWGATLLELDGETIQCGGGCYYSEWLTTYRQFASGRNVSELGKLRPKPFDYIAGASMWMPTAVLEEQLMPPPRLAREDQPSEPEWLNETFFLYFEELDLARRLSAGRRLGWCRDAVIVHGRRLRGDIRMRRKSAEFNSDLSALKYTTLHQPNKLWFALPARFVLKLFRHLLLLRWYLVPSLLRAYATYFGWRLRLRRN